MILHKYSIMRFNTQPPEGGWAVRSAVRLGNHGVSTHSRLKAAGANLWDGVNGRWVSTHSRLKAAGFAKFT